MEENKNTEPTNKTTTPGSKIKTRTGGGYLKQLYSTARTTAGSTHSQLKNLTTFLVNFVPIDKVNASELQVRTHFDDEEIAGLSKSIKEHGVLQPILVVQDGDEYKVIAGERRLRASKEAGLDRIPARVINTDDKATHEIALRENLDRVDLHPIEEGEGYLSLLESKAYTSYDLIAKAFMKPKSRITECIGYTRLPDLTKQMLLKIGLKQRSLLRKLMDNPPESHSAIIEELAKSDDLISLDPDNPESKKAAASGSPEKKAKPRKRPKDPPFHFQSSDRGLQVPGFKWKSGQGEERLQQYLDELYKLIESIEERLKKN